MADWLTDSIVAGKDPRRTPEQDAEAAKLRQEEEEANADIEIAYATLRAEAEKLPPGQSPYNPIRRKRGIGGFESQVVKGLGSDVSAQKKWLEAEPTGESWGPGIPTGSKPKSMAWIGSLGEEKSKQYDVVEWKPGELVVRPKGSKEPWTVIDEEGFSSADIIHDLLPSLIAYGSTPFSSVPRAALGAAGAQAGIEGVGAAYGIEKDPAQVVDEIATAGAAGALMQPAAKAVGMVGRKALGTATQKVGKLLQAPEKKLEQFTGQAAKDENRVLRQQLEIDKARAASEGKSAIRQDKERLRQETDPAFQATKNARADVEAEREAWRKTQDAARAEQERLAGELKPRDPIDGGVAGEPRPAPVEIPKENLAIIEAKPAPATQAGRSTFEGMDANTIHPALGVSQKVLSAWPEMIAHQQRTLGQGAVQEVGSMSMESRLAWANRAARQYGPEKWNKALRDYEVGAAELIENDPIYKWALKNERHDAALRRLAARKAIPGDEKILSNLQNAIAKEKFRPTSLTKAIRTYQGTLPATAAAQAKKKAGISAIESRKDQLATAIDEITKRQINARQANLDLPEPMKIPLVPKVTQTMAAGGKLFERVGDKILSAGPAALAVKAKAAPPRVKSILRKIVEEIIASTSGSVSPSALSRGGSIEATKAMIEKALRDPSFRDWAKREFGSEN